MKYLFYSLASVEKATDVPWPQKYSWRLWKPSPGERKPPRTALYPYIAYWLMHRAQLFSNRDYAVFLVSCGQELVHESVVTPADFRYPFMNAADLQIGNVRTVPEHRGRGLAAMAIAGIVQALGRPGRSFWYLTDENNAASQRVAEKAGFRLTGLGVRQNVLGLPFLGRYEFR